MVLLPPDVRFDFYPRPLRGGRHSSGINRVATVLFLSTPSARRATTFCSRPERPPGYFYPRPLRGGRHLAGDDTTVLVQFLSTPSARRATALALDGREILHISIHALCEEGDLALYELLKLLSNFYPRPLRGGRRTSGTTPTAGYYFYPRPLRGGRHQGHGHHHQPEDFYPRPLRGGRRVCASGKMEHWGISIHALCEEGDILLPPTPGTQFDFYPRPLRGGRHMVLVLHLSNGTISIHALCEEGDISVPDPIDHYIKISIHALCEEGDWITWASSAA